MQRGRASPEGVRQTPEAPARAPRVAQAGGPRARQRERRELSAAALSEVALAYLNRRDASHAKLKRHLEDWVRRRATPPDLGAARPLIDEILARYRESGLVSDTRFAANAVRSLRRRGSSKRIIAQKLSLQGIDGTTIASALASDAREYGSNDLAAAVAYVRRRKLGALRPEAERSAARRRDLAALARAGFDFDTARAALGTNDGDDEF